MDEGRAVKKQEASDQLALILRTLTENYRLLLDIVRKEKDCLIQADIDSLQLVNKQKELLLYQLKNLDQERAEVAVVLAKEFECEPRLLEIAAHLEAAAKINFERQHDELTVLITRIQELNSSNETFAKSALKGLSGALADIKETLLGKKTYEKRGQYKSANDSSGSFVRKEA